MTHRSGMTLVETLVAIFIMAIGLLALLTLFPLGALNMAQAIKDQRVAEAGRNAGAIADMTFEQNVPYSPTVLGPVQWTMRSDALLNTPNQGALFNPCYPPPPQGSPPPGFPNNLPDLTGATSPTYPVLVDPIGYQLFSQPSGACWCPSANNPPNYSGIPRRTMRILLPVGHPLGLNVDPSLNNNASLTKQIYRWTTLLDDINFDENGVPDLTTGSVQREGRYSWAWLVQAPAATAATGPTPVVSVKVLVFSGRSLDLNSGTLSAQGENSYMANFGTDYTGTATPRVINIQWSPSQPRPNLTANSWVLDAPTNPVNRVAAFYRVVSVTDTGTAANGNSMMDVEVQNDLVPQGSSGFVIVLDNLVEVIDRLTQ